MRFFRDLTVYWRSLMAGIMLTLCLVSCESFLDVDFPKNKIERDDVFEKASTADQAILGIYSNVMIGFGSGDGQSLSTLCALSADELVMYQRNTLNLPEFDENDLRAQNQSVQVLWSSLYKTIYLANSAIEGLDNSSQLSDDIKNPLKGEALFMRAFCHFYLVNLFGDVPLITTTDFNQNAHASRASVELVYGQVIEDLKRAKELLPNEYKNGERIRVNRSASIAFLARVYLYHKDWMEAEQEATEVIGNLQYSLVELDSVFLADSKEAIWQLRPGIGSSGSTLGAAGEAITFLPPQVLNNSVLRINLVNAFEVNDERFGEWVRKYATIYHPYKYRQGDPTKTLTEYSMVMRLPEQLFIRAEARANLDNVTGVNSAESDLNEIRARAGLGNTTAVTQEEMLLAIEHERRVELFAEWGHRWFDLKRTGRADAILDPLKPKWSAIDVLYPIPQVERNNNPNLNPQNPGY